MRKFAVLIAAALAIGGCATAEAPQTAQDVSRPGDNSALSTMERVAVAAQRCWFAGADARFRGLQMSPELSSFTGRPRILAVPSGNIAGLPKLVVQATGSPASLDAFGPMMQGSDRAGIAADVTRWAGGDASCRATA